MANQQEHKAGFNPTINLLPFEESNGPRKAGNAGFSGNGSLWHPSFVKRLPTLGVLALVGSILCMHFEGFVRENGPSDSGNAAVVAAIIDLTISNGKPTSSWSRNVQPTVWLAATSALANILLTYALSVGVVTYFWRRAVRGTTVRKRRGSLEITEI